jgi:hypothetical protein
MNSGKTARRPAVPVPGPVCRLPGCGTPLTGRQERACSGRHRAALNRQERQDKGQARVEEIRGLLEAALRRLGPP